MRTLLKPLFHSFLVLGSVIALSNCGNSKNDDDSQTGTTVPRQKNAALSFTTVITAPKVVTSINGGIRPMTTVLRSVPTTTVLLSATATTTTDPRSATTTIVLATTTTFKKP
jgi:hypothetical protein